VGGSAVTKIGNTGRGTDGMGGWGTRDKGFSLGPVKLYVCGEGGWPHRSAEWAVGPGVSVQAFA
jgi:hypothetical protein